MARAKNNATEQSTETPVATATVASPTAAASDATPLAVQSESSVDMPAAARALVDLPMHRVRCGGLLVAAAGVIAALVAAGDADDHPDAIAAAQAQD